MELFFNYATPVVYWLLIIIWSFILIFYLKKIQGVSTYDGLLKLALIILAIDAFRTVFESVYFGAWYTSLSGLIPIEIFNYLAQPEIVFVPKIINLVVAILILTILIKRWLISEISQKQKLSELIAKQIQKIEEISENHKQEKEKAEESEMNFRKSIENAPYPIMIHAEGEVTHLSKIWTEITGYDISDIPTIAKWTEKAYGSKAVPTQKFIDALYTIKTKQYDGEWEIRIKSGEKRIWEFSSSPIGRLSDGKKAVISMAVDITEKKILENNLIAEKNKAEESDRLKSAFLANMSHEIRTPMNGILGFADLLKTPGLKSSKQEKYIQIIEKSGVRMLNIINDIIDISKIESGHMSVDIAESNINE